MSHDTPRARKTTQRDAYASGKWFDAAIGVSWLTRRGAVLSHCRVMPEACFQHDAKACKPRRFAALSLLPAARNSSRQYPSNIEYEP